MIQLGNSNISIQKIKLVYNQIHISSSVSLTLDLRQALPWKYR